MIDFADCVEAHITGIAILEESKAISLSFRGREGQRFVLAAKGVDRFIANEFREQNIVDRVVLWDSTSESGEYLAALTALLTGANDELTDVAWQALIEEEIAAIKRQEKVLIEIEPVFGASIVCLAREVALVR